MVIDISEEELHQEVVAVRVKRILGTPPLQEAKEQFVDLVIQSEEYLGGASLYLTTSEVGSLVHTSLFQIDGFVQIQNALWFF